MSILRFLLHGYSYNTVINWQKGRKKNAVGTCMGDTLREEKVILSSEAVPGGNERHQL